MVPNAIAMEWLGFSNPCGMQVTTSQREEPGAPEVSLYDLCVWHGY